MPSPDLHDQFRSLLKPKPTRSISLACFVSGCLVGIAATAATLGLVQASIVERISAFEARLMSDRRADRGSLDVAEFDRGASRVSGPCERGSDCQIIVRFRRTPAGQHCPVPGVSAGMVTPDGEIVNLGMSDYRPVQGTGEWMRLAIVLHIPKNVATGTGFAFLTSTYHDCPAPGQSTTQNSPLFPIEIIRAG